MIPTLQFNYLSIDDFPKMIQIMDAIISSGVATDSAGPDLINTDDNWYRSLINRYVITSHESDKNFHICETTEYWCDDIACLENSEDNHVLQTLLSSKIKYGNLLTEFVIKDSDIILRKMKYIIDFMMTQVYKTDTMRIVITHAKKGYDRSSFPQILKHCLDINYDLIERDVVIEESKFLIKRRVSDESTN